VYWDQNSRAAKPVGFFASILIRSVPFALLFALTRGMDPIGVQVLAGALGIRLAAVAGILWRLQDREALRNILLMPLQDFLSVATWALSFTQRTILWRGQEYRLTAGGRMELRRGDA
jgi:ceramide glucosyltransferase